MWVKNKFIYVICLFAVSFVLLFSGCGANSKRPTGISSIKEITNQTIGVQTGTLYEDSLLATNPDVSIKYFTVATDLLVALEQGKIDGFLIESVTYEITKEEYPWLKLLEGTTESTPVGVAISDNNALIQKQLNTFIKERTADGTMAELNKYWIEEYTDDCYVDKSGITGKNGKVGVAVESGYTPFSYFRKDELCGYDIDFIYRFCREYGYEPEFYNVEYADIPIGLSTGKFDLGMNVIISEERGENVIISDAYNSIDIQIAVMGEKENTKSFISSITESFNNTFVKEGRWKLFVGGILVTLLVASLSIIFGIILGFLLYLFNKDGNKVINKISAFLGWLFGDIPAVLFLMILYYIVFVGKATINGIGVSVVGFSILFGYTVSELLETGVMAVGKGQVEGARALGYSSNQTFFNVILPQASRVAFPGLKREIVSLIKETSIVGYISVMDLTKVSDIVRGRTFESFFPLITTTIIYLFIIRFIIFFVNRIEFLVTNEERSVKMIKKGIKTK